MKYQLERPSFVLVLIFISALFLMLMKPFVSILLWSSIIGFLFRPLYLWLNEKWNGKENLASLVTLFCCVVMVILPGLFIMTTMVGQGVDLYEQLDRGELDPGVLLDQLNQVFPFFEDLLGKLNINFSELKDKLTETAVNSSESLAKNTFLVGKNTVQFFVQLGLFIYVAFYFIRDGGKITDSIKKCIPLDKNRIDLLFSKFKEVTRATIKGNFVVAAIQGTLGGLIFFALGLPGAFLWGVVMIILSLIPVVGAALVWIPAAIYLFTSGDTVKSFILVGFGAIVIGLADNLLRPLLVGRDTKLPDYLVLLSTLGGFTLFGLNGFVLGPMVAVLFMTLWQVFSKEYTY